MRKILLISTLALLALVLAAALPFSRVQAQTVNLWCFVGGTGPASQQWSPCSIGGAVAPTDCSGAIASGGTAQTLIAAASGAKGFQIQNIDTSEPLWISFTGTAAAAGTGSFVLAQGTATTFASSGSYYSPIGFTTAISIVGATTSHKFSCTRW